MMEDDTSFFIFKFIFSHKYTIHLIKLVLPNLTNNFFVKTITTCFYISYGGILFIYGVPKKNEKIKRIVLANLMSNVTKY